MFYVFYCVLFMFIISMTNAEPACSQYHFMEQILEKLVRMEFDVSKMMTESKTLAAEMNQELTQIKEERDHLRGELTNLKTQQKNMMIEYEKNQTRELENIANFAREVNQTQSIFRSDLLGDINNLTKLKTVSFLARLPTDSTPRTSQVIIYGTVLDNTGDGYDVNTGIFTAPEKGLYSFSLHMCIYTGKYFFYGIVKNDNYLVRGRIYDKGGSFPCSSATVFTSMEKGEKVWVKCTFGDSQNQLYVGDPIHWNSFTGALIHM